MRIFIVISLLISISGQTQVDVNNSHVERITKEKAITIAKSKRFYIDTGKWQASARLDTIKNTWTIKSWVRERVPYNGREKFKGDVLQKVRTITIDAYSGKVKKKKRKKVFITYMP
jgi:hypothetical protein